MTVIFLNHVKLPFQFCGWSRSSCPGIGCCSRPCGRVYSAQGRRNRKRLGRRPAARPATPATPPAPPRKRACIWTWQCVNISTAKRMWNENVTGECQRLAAWRLDRYGMSRRFIINCQVEQRQQQETGSAVLLDKNELEETLENAIRQGRGGAFVGVTQRATASIPPLFSRPFSPSPPPPPSRPTYHHQHILSYAHDSRVQQRPQIRFSFPFQQVVISSWDWVYITQYAT